MISPRNEVACQYFSGQSGVFEHFPFEGGTLGEANQFLEEDPQGTSHKGGTSAD